KNIYLNDIRVIDRSVDMTSYAPYYSHSKDYNPSKSELEDAELLDNSWFYGLFNNPFYKNSIEAIDNDITRVPCSRLMHVLSHFYKSVDQIIQTKAAEQSNDIESFISETTFQKHAKLFQIDKPFVGENGSSYLRAHVQNYTKRDNVFAIITFVDLTDPFSIAQCEFNRLMMKAVNAQYPDLELELLEIAIKDSEGVEMNQADYEYFHSQNRFNVDFGIHELAPFSMVFSSVHEDILSDQKRFDFMKDKRWFDYDLFDYRQDSSVYSNTLVRDNSMFRTNLKMIAGKIMTAAGLMLTPVVMTDYRDLTHLPEYALFEKLEKMNQFAGLVLVHPDNDEKTMNTISSACATATGCGAPFVTIVQTKSVEIGKAIIPCGFSMNKRITVDDFSSVDPIINAITEAYDSNVYLRVLEGLNLYS
ncbi:MAG: hypothetical protein AAF901_12505, partial [Bacteroidota bacterium]